MLFVFPFLNILCHPTFLFSSPILIQFYPGPLLLGTCLSLRAFLNLADVSPTETPPASPLSWLLT